jgi:hypothetical protein
MKTTLILATLMLTGCAGTQLTTNPNPGGAAVTVTPGEDGTTQVNMDPATTGSVIGTIIGSPETGLLLGAVTAAVVAVMQERRNKKSADAAFDEGVSRAAKGEVKP